MQLQDNQQTSIIKDSNCVIIVIYRSIWVLFGVRIEYPRTTENKKKMEV